MWVTSTWSFVGTHPESNLGHHNDRWMVTYPRGPLVRRIFGLGLWRRPDRVFLCRVDLVRRAGRGGAAEQLVE